MRSEIQGTDDIRFTLFDNPNFTGNANAVCDYTITGTYNINGGAINQPYTTIMATNDHNHTYNTGSNITGFTITSVVPACPCVLVVFNQVTPTPSITQTQTNTPTNTQTNTPTPSITLTATTANLDITNGSLDIQITSVYVNSVITTVTGGSLPNTTGNGTNLETTQVGVYTVEVNYSAGVAGQKITLTDSDLFSTCQNTSTGSNTMTFTSVKVATYTNVIIDAQDGTC
jgi:hypothetical protein